jgi:DNA-binding transcriptional MerR regulator
MHRIGEVAEEVGLSLRTIRHYEDVGLVPPSGRTAGGFRLYTDDDVERLRLVKRMKPLEFSLDEVREVLETRDGLAAPDGGDGARDRLRERLAGFAAAAETRCDALREQLAVAEGVAEMLRREARRRGAAAAPR